MKSFRQFREECECKDKKSKGKKKGTVEIMPTIRDGEKGMVTKPTNEAFFGNYPGPLYAPHPDLLKNKQARRVLFTLMLAAALVVVKPLLFKAMSSCQVKKLVVDLLERYVKSTDNDVDDLIAATVKTALLKGCE